MSDDDRVIIACSDPGTETAAVVFLKVLFCGNQDVCRRIQPQEFGSPLLRQVVGHDKHALAAQTQAFALHGGRHHFIGFSCADHVRQQRISSIQGVCDRVPLMIPQGNLRIHAGKSDVLPVIFTGPDAVEQFVVFRYQSFTPVRVAPDPVPESVLDCLLLLLGQGGFFLIQHTLSSCCGQAQ